MHKTSFGAFVHELPLIVLPEDDRELVKRLNAARQIYNSCLGECLKQIALIRQSKQWQRARLLPKSKKLERKKLFQDTKKRHRFSEYALHTFVGLLRKSCWIQRHIDSSTAQKIATTAFRAAEQYLLGKRGKPRFKSYGRMLKEDRCLSRLVDVVDTCREPQRAMQFASRTP